MQSLYPALLGIVGELLLDIGGLEGTIDPDGGVVVTNVRQHSADGFLHPQTLLRTLLPVVHVETYQILGLGDPGVRKPVERAQWHFEDLRVLHLEEGSLVGHRDLLDIGESFVDEHETTVDLLAMGAE